MSNKKIKILLVLVERKFGLGSSRKWKNGDFEKLSFDINQKTKTLISVATLKRIFGKVQVSEGYQPNISTLDALKDFADYDISINKYEKQKSNRIRIAVVTLAVIIVTGMFIFLGRYNEPKNIKAVLSVESIEGKCPSTVSFSFKIPKSENDVFLNPGNGNNTIAVSKVNEASVFYPFPGLFEARLSQNEMTISKPANVLVQTDGWQAFAYYFENIPDKRYHPIPLQKATTNGYFHPEARLLYGLGLDTTKLISTRLDNYKLTDLSVDNFVYASKLKNDSFWPGMRCYAAIVTVQGTLGKIQFKLVGNGCSVYSHLIYGDKRILKQSELSKLAVDIGDWQEIELTNAHKKMSLMVNQKKIFEDSYEQSMGKLVGTSIEFHGSGTIESVDLHAKDFAVFQYRN
ncbi:MAG: hypothetical protein JXR03_02995 [Cyclobacteriaceae bacterium]